MSKRNPKKHLIAAQNRAKQRSSVAAADEEQRKRDAIKDQLIKQAASVKNVQRQC